MGVMRSDILDGVKSGPGVSPDQCSADLIFMITKARLNTTKIGENSTVKIEDSAGSQGIRRPPPPVCIHLPRV